MTHLLDSNVLVALTVGDHVHHQASTTWFAGFTGTWATCPITQGALLRLLLQEGQPPAVARGVLDRLTSQDRHRFWPDDPGYAEIDLGHVVGHRQVTDAYLAGLARHHGGRLATFDQGLAQQAADVATLIPIA